MRKRGRLLIKKAETCKKPSISLKVIKKEVINDLKNAYGKKHGFRKVRRRGSHIAMQKKTPESTVTIPVPDHNEIRIGTLMSIIRQSGLTRSEFE